MFDFLSVKKSVDDAAARMAVLRTELQELQSKRQNVHLAPAAKDDVKAMVSRWVREGAGTHAATIRETVANMARNPSAMANHIDRAKQLASLGGARTPLGELPAQEFGQAICLIFGKQIDEAILREIDAMEWPVNAVPQAKRTEMVAALDEKIVANETEQADIVNKAAEVGLRLNLE